MTTQISGQNAVFLRKEFYLPQIFKILESDLTFINPSKPGMIPAVKADGKAVNYKQETTSAGSDTHKKTPRVKTPTAKWAYVEIDQMEKKSAILQEKGVAIKIDRDAVTSVQGVDEIKRAFSKVSFWMAQAINTDIITAITDGATTPTWTPTAEWSEATATPVDDLLNLEPQMERDGYPYELTDVYVHKTNFAEMKGYLTSVDIADGKQKNIYGMPNISKDTIHVPVIQSDVHKLKSGLTEGYVLGLDRNNPCGTYYYNNDPMFAPAKIKYDTIEAGKKVTRTVNNIGINTHQYFDNDSHCQIIQLWYDGVAVVKEPYAALYDSGI